MDLHIEENISSIINPSNSLNLIAKSCTFSNLPGCIYSILSADCLISWNSFEKSHTKSTVFLKSSTKISFEGNCIFSCDGKNAENNDGYGRVTRLEPSNHLFSSFNHYHRCKSVGYMEYLVSNETEHYSSNYSLNDDSTCAGPLLLGRSEIKSSMIYSYKCFSVQQIEFFSSKKVALASRLVFVDCFQQSEGSYELSVYEIHDDFVISDSSFIRSLKTYDCKIGTCTVTFKGFYTSRNSFCCASFESGSATASDCYFNANEVKQSLGAFRRGCAGPLCTREAKPFNRRILSIGVLGLNGENKVMS